MNKAHKNYIGDTFSNSNFFNYEKGCIKNNIGESVYIEPRLKELLHILLKNKNEFVSRDELISFVWKETFVSEQSLTKAISDLRKFLSNNNIKILNIVSKNKIGYKIETSGFIDAKEKKTNNIRLLFKVLIYIVISLLFLVILVRAIRY